MNYGMKKKITREFLSCCVSVKKTLLLVASWQREHGADDGDACERRGTGEFCFV